MRLARKSLSLVAAALMSVGLMSPVSQAQAERIVVPEEQDAYVQEFFQDGDVTPLVNGSGGLTDADIEAFHQAVRDAEQADPLNDEIIAGEMLSDKIILPPQVDKATSDEAEVAVAKQQAQPQTLATTAATCHRFIFTAYDVCGAILQRYNQLGGLLSFLLDPIGPQIQNPDGVGFHQQFRNGFIFWRPDTGAHAITARNAEVFSRNGWSAGWMGYPLGGEVPVTGSNPIDGELNGWVQLFQGGRIYRSPVWEGFQVASINGMILDRWLAIGGPDSALGFPIADEAVAADGVGRFSVFHNGVIYWHPNYGAWEIYGDFEGMWMTSGGVDGLYGYPTSGINSDSTGTWQDYEGGQIFVPSDDSHRKYNCMDVVGLILQRIGREDAAADFYCDDQGATVSLDGEETHFYAPTKTMLESSSSSSFAPQSRALPGVECNSIGFVDASPAIRLSSYSVRKNIDTCVGTAIDRIPVWSKEFSYSIKHTLTQRQHHKVELTISSLTFPTRIFEQKYQLKEDLWMQPDPTRGPVLYTANGGTNTAPSVVTGAIPKKGGTYYLQATDFTLKIPSKNYEMTASKWNGARLNIGRFECDLFDEKLADDNKVCEFPHPVDGS